MKLSNKLTTACVAGLLLASSNAMADVRATAYLNISSLFAEVDADLDGIFDENPNDFVSIGGGSRETSSDASFNGSALQSQPPAVGATGTSDASFLCSGPDCGSIGLTENSVTLGSVVADSSLNYALADTLVSGSALDGGARGFTYGDVGIATANNFGNANSNIENNLITRVAFTVGGTSQTIAIRLRAVYDAFVDSFISAAIAADNSRTGTANATSSFSFRLTAGSAGASVTRNFDGEGRGFEFTDNAFDDPDFNDAIQFNIANALFTSDSFNLTSGNYQLSIVQQSDVSATLVPEPGAIVLFGMGLLGLGLRARTKAAK